MYSVGCVTVIIGLALIGECPISAAQTSSKATTDLSASGDEKVVVTSNCGKAKLRSPSSFRVAASTADSIFVGDILRISVVPEPFEPPPGLPLTLSVPSSINVTMLEFATVDLIKGPASSVIEVRTQWLGPGGLDFRAGQRCLVFAARERNDRLWTDPFKRTKSADLAASEIKRLKRKFASRQ